MSCPPLGKNISNEELLDAAVRRLESISLEGCVKETAFCGSFDEAIHRIGPAGAGIPFTYAQFNPEIFNQVLQALTQIQLPDELFSRPTSTQLYEKDFDPQQSSSELCPKLKEVVQPILTELGTLFREAKNIRLHSGFIRVERGSATPDWHKDRDRCIEWRVNQECQTRRFIMTLMGPSTEWLCVKAEKSDDMDEYYPLGSLIDKSIEAYVAKNSETVFSSPPGCYTISSLNNLWRAVHRPPKCLGEKRIILFVDFSYTNVTLSRKICKSLLFE
jgi:hypothetical protein